METDSVVAGDDSDADGSLALMNAGTDLNGDGQLDAADTVPLNHAYRTTTRVPGRIKVGRRTASQLANRMQPALLVRPMVSGDAVP